MGQPGPQYSIPRSAMSCKGGNDASLDAACRRCDPADWCGPSLRSRSERSGPITFAGRHGPAVEYSGSKARRGSSRRPAGDHSQAEIFPMLLRSRWAAPSGFIELCLPSRASRPPSGPDWIHEINQDGYRLMARRDPTGISLLTRSGHDWEPRYPLIVEAVDRLKVSSTVRAFGSAPPPTMPSADFCIWGLSMQH